MQGIFECVLTYPPLENEPLVFLSSDTSLISFWGKECYICTTKVKLQKIHAVRCRFLEKEHLHEVMVNFSKHSCAEIPLFCWLVRQYGRHDNLSFCTLTQSTHK